MTPSQELGPCHACKIVGGWAEPETLLDGSPDKIEAQLSNTNAPTKSLLESTLKKSLLERMRKLFSKERKKERKKEKAVQNKKRKRKMQQLKTVLFCYLEASIASLKLKKMDIKWCAKPLTFGLH